MCLLSTLATVDILGHIFAGTERDHVPTVCVHHSKIFACSFTNDSLLEPARLIRFPADESVT